MKKRISDTALIAAAMAFSLFLSGIISAAEAKKSLEKNIVRLHILAASDSEKDQAMKLKVRDALLEESEEIFVPCRTHEEACLSLENNMDRIRDIAENTLRENGCTDPVSCELERIPFDKRVYGDFTVPAGTYTALRVKLGSGEGHNWWCVMYPPLCVPCAGGIDGDIMAEYGGDLSEEDILMLTDSEDFEVRLFFAEFIKGLFDKKAVK